MTDTGMTEFLRERAHRTGGSLRRHIESGVVSATRLPESEGALQPDRQVLYALYDVRFADGARHRIYVFEDAVAYAEADGLGEN